MCDFVLQNVWVIFETNFEKNMGENVRKAKDVFLFNNEKMPMHLTRTNGQTAQKKRSNLKWNQ